jgi:hypothetical protein
MAKKKLFNFNNILLVLLLVFIIFVIYQNFYNSSQNMSNYYSQLTDKWIKEVTINRNPTAVANLFCKDATLVATVSTKLRKGKQIKEYFKFFTSLPGIKVLNREYNISKINNNYFINTAMITWYWEGLDKPLVVRMSFVYKNDCIFQLHASAMPEKPDELYAITNN